jgi:hypothetical protein
VRASAFRVTDECAHAPVVRGDFHLPFKHYLSPQSCAPAPTATQAKSAFDTESTLKFLVAAAMRVWADCSYACALSLSSPLQLP